MSLNYRFSNDKIVFKQDKLKEIIDFANEILDDEKEEILQSIKYKHMKKV